MTMRMYAAFPASPKRNVGRLRPSYRYGCNSTLIAPSCFFWNIS